MWFGEEVQFIWGVVRVSLPGTWSQNGTVESKRSFYACINGDDYEHVSIGDSSIHYVVALIALLSVYRLQVLGCQLSLGFP